jgi:hypothetical protein
LLAGMSHVERFMPDYRLREVDHVAVTANPEAAFRAVRELDFNRLAFARWLFALRTLPERLRGGIPPAKTARLEQITAPGSGFHLLAELDREIVVGSVGRFWEPRIQFADVAPEGFVDFDAPGWGKLAWSIAVVPRRGGGAWITFDLRVDATSDAAWTRFSRYWLLIGRFSRLMRRALLRLFRRELGAAPDAGTRTLPGDELLPAAQKQLTHSVFIEAAPAAVWPWLVQMGCRRAGWYSWDRLDNAGERSADRVIPELQHIAVGDVLPATPHGDGGFAVLELEAPRALVLGSPSLLPGGQGWGTPYDATWSFALEPIGDAATELVVRVRAYEPGTRRTPWTAVIPLVHDFMERKQLRTLKQRVEGEPATLVRRHGAEGV